MTTSITFIGGPLDLTRTTFPGKPPPYYRYAKAPEIGPLYSKPTMPSVIPEAQCADYEIIPYSHGPGKMLYVGIFMEPPP